jgi:hypothetical protein
MKRIEIIGNRSIEDDLFDILKEKELDKVYTKIPVVMGVGSSGPRMGDHIWPEENFLLVFYLEEKQVKTIKKLLTEFKRCFPQEGIKLFEMDVVDSL